MARPDFFCKECEGIIAQGGVMLIEVSGEGQGNENERRTGRVWGMSKEWTDRVGQKPGVCYILEADARQCGFPHPEPQEA
jgi:hypothetical protein